MKKSVNKPRNKQVQVSKEDSFYNRMLNVPVMGYCCLVFDSFNEANRHRVIIQSNAYVYIDYADISSFTVAIPLNKGIQPSSDAVFIQIWCRNSQGGCMGVETELFSESVLMSSDVHQAFVVNSEDHYLALYQLADKNKRSVDLLQVNIQSLSNPRFVTILYTVPVVKKV